jgi:hypothetical protein
MRGQLER